MSRRDFIRLFWIGAAATLVVAALLSVFAVLSGSFDDTDWKILGSLATLLLAGAVASAGAALRETRDSTTLGPVLALGAPVLALIGVVAMAKGWEPDGLARFAGVAYVLLGVGLVAGTGRVLARTPRQTLPFAIAAGSAALAGLLGIIAIVTGEGGDWQAMVAILIVMALAYVLIPVTGRIAETATTGDESPVRVDLAQGVSVGGARVRLVDATTTLTGESVVLGLAGRTAVGTLAVDAGGAVRAPSGTTVRLEDGARAVVVVRG